MKRIQKLEEYVKSYQAMRAMLAEVEAEKAILSESIKQILIEEGLSEYKSDVANVIFREQIRKSIDSKALRSELPEVAERYTRETSAMVLRIA